MPQDATPVALMIGTRPPANPSARTRWLSQSHRHLRIPPGAYTRRPILGSNILGRAESASQEMNAWWNPYTKRVEGVFNMGSQQRFTSAPTPYGPWATQVPTLGNGVGGESGGITQFRTYVEGDTIYAIGGRTISDVNVRLWSSPMPRNLTDAVVWTYLGVAYTDTTGSGSGWIIKVDGKYRLFLERGARMRYCESAAASMDELVAKPFTLVNDRVNFGYNVGVRSNSAFGRPVVFYEDGTWILYGHATGTLDFGYQWIQRYTCTDPLSSPPTNWVPDGEGQFLREEHPLEVDQVADFLAVQLPNDRWWAFWSGCNNPATEFSIMTAPMQEPMMAYDGGDWLPAMVTPDALADFPYINSDIANGNQALKNRWDTTFDTSSAAINATLPQASSHVAVTLSNHPRTLPGNHVRLLPKVATDRIHGPISISSVSASGTTVTVSTVQPHGLNAADFVTVTGFTPTAYNINGVAVASVVDANTFTYTAGSAPAAVTTTGCYDRSLRPGESRAYRCRNAGTFVRAAA